MILKKIQVRIVNFHFLWYDSFSMKISFEPPSKPITVEKEIERTGKRFFPNTIKKSLYSKHLKNSFVAIFSRLSAKITKLATV